jgi:hypothetical protein
MSWNTGRPIHDRLPGALEAYRKDEDWDGYDAAVDPPIGRWLTAAWDGLLMDTKVAIEGIPANMLDPATAKPEFLDWLAQLCGFTGDYWDTTWSVPVKRQLIARSLDYIWENKGTRELLEWLFTLFDLQVQVYLIGDFLAGVNAAGDPVSGGRDFEYFLLVSLAYLPPSPYWSLVERLNRLYAPVYASSTQCYDHFYAGFSSAGQPVL